VDTDTECGHRYNMEHIDITCGHIDTACGHRCNMEHTDITCGQI
jgi:hypothetical protein